MLAALQYGLPVNVPQPISDPEINIAESGWDTYAQRFLLLLSGVTISDSLAAHFPSWVGHPTYSNMYLSPPKVQSIGANAWEIDCEWKGEFQPRGYRRTAKILGETSTGENITVGLGGDYPAFVSKLKIEQPVLSVETTYIQAGFPDLTEVKKPIGALPGGFPALPTPPSQIWSSITDPTYVYPAGWVLDDRDTNQLGASVLYEVTDRHIFRYVTEM